VSPPICLRTLLHLLTARIGPTLPTWTLPRAGRYLGYTSRDGDVVVTAAHDPLPELGVLRKCEVTGTRRLTQL